MYKQSTRLTKLLQLELPIIQAGMVWVSGGKLASASANAGILGTIGAGSMTLELLEQHIIKAKKLTTHHHRLAVNLPLLYHGVNEQIELALKLGIRVFITSAGSPKLYTDKLKGHGAMVGHVIANPLLAQKCEQAHVDFVIAEGFEAGGHNGREELTTMTLVPQVTDAVSIPVVAAGGIADARTIRAAFALGADGVQMGTRFMLTQESSAHAKYKELLLNAKFDSTELVLKKHVPVRLFKNKFYNEIKELEKNNVNLETLVGHLGKGRAKLGMLGGDLDEGELEVGQIVSMIHDLPTVADFIKKLVQDLQ